MFINLNISKGFVRTKGKNKKKFNQTQ